MVVVVVVLVAAAALRGASAGGGGTGSSSAPVAAVCETGCSRNMAISLGPVGGGRGSSITAGVGSMVMVMWALLLVCAAF